MNCITSSLFGGVVTLCSENVSQATEEIVSVHEQRIVFVQMFEGDKRVVHLGDYPEASHVLEQVVPRRGSRGFGLLSQRKQLLWFVSHLSGQAFSEFLPCVDRPSQGRNLDIYVPYHVSAFCVNHHKGGGELGDNSSSQDEVVRAMKVVKGKLPSIDCESSFFTRAWCCFEAMKGFQHMSCDEGGKCRDLATNLDNVSMAVAC